MVLPSTFDIGAGEANNRFAATVRQARGGEREGRPCHMPQLVTIWWLWASMRTKRMSKKKVCTLRLLSY